MTKVKFLNASSTRALEDEVNKFVRDKDIVSVSFSTGRLGYSLWFYCSVLYRENH